MEMKEILFTKKQVMKIKLKKKMNRKKNMKEGDKDIENSLTAKRLVNSIEAALDIPNYNPIVLPENTTSYTTKLRGRNENTETTINFTNKPRTYSGMQRQCDIIKEPLVLRGIAVE